MRTVAWAGLVTVTILAGCLNHFESQPSPHELRISDLDVSAPVVSSGNIVFAVNITLDNMGGSSDAVRLVVKAFDSGTQLLTSTNESTLPGLKKDQTRTVEIRLSLPRATGYRFEVVGYERERIVQTAQVTVNNVAALPANLFQTGLKISSMDFLVRNVTGGRVEIEVQVALTNEGPVASKPLRLQLKAREVSTDLLADEASAALESIPPEATKTTSVKLQVPEKYNYLVEAIVWDGDFIAERGSGRVQLLPTFTKPAGEDLLVSTPQISDFVRAAPPGAAAPGATKTPGPGLASTLIVLVGLVLWRRGGTNP